MEKIFRNRSEAGKLLAKKIFSTFVNRSDVIVLGLPRGGVPVAYQVAKLLHLPLDICLVRKLGVPGHQEVAMGAIARGGIAFINQDLVDRLKISPMAIEKVIDFEKKELERREVLYRGPRPLPNLEGKNIILIDDGIATGSTINAALSSIKQHKSKGITVAIPVAPPDVFKALQDRVDEIVCLRTPISLFSVSLWYEDFSQTSDEEVRYLLAKNRHELATISRMGQVNSQEENNNISRI